MSNTLVYWCTLHRSPTCRIMAWWHVNWLLINPTLITLISAITYARILSKQVVHIEVVFRVCYSGRRTNEGRRS